MDADLTTFTVRTFIATLLSSGLIAFVGGVLFKRKTDSIAGEVKTHFDQMALVYSSTRAWKEKALSELLGPMVMHLDRTRRAFNRWKKQNLYIETKVIREGNIAIRDLLLTKGHLIPPYLLEDAGRLVEHYDQWLEEYEKNRGGTDPKPDEPFTYAGPAGYPFPGDAEQRFKDLFQKLSNELYGSDERRSGTDSRS
jgi:hypothetical protein